MKEERKGLPKAWGTACIFMALIGAFALAETTEGANISIAGGPAGGAYYPLSVGMSEIIGKNIPGYGVDVVATAGSVENAIMVGTGESEISITNGDVAYEAYTGTGRYQKKKLPDIRVLFAGIAGGPLHVVVPKASDIKSYAQMKGKKVAIGPQGGSTPYMALSLLKYYGVQKSDMRLSYLNYEDGMQALQDGHVNVSMAVGPMPLPSLKQMATFGKFAFDMPSVESDKAQAFLKDYPFFNLVTIPAPLYGLGYEVKTISSTNIVVVNAKVSEDLVYRITKAIFENLGTMHSAHPAGKTIKLETAPVKYLPMHPGAEKYFREKGVMK